MNTLYNDVYRTIYKNRLFEDVNDLSSGNTRATLKMGTIETYDDTLGKIVKIDLKTVVKAVNSAFSDISVRYDFLYEYIKKCKPMYVLTPPENKACMHDTMSVDPLGNLWMNVHFIYRKLNCDKRKIFVILFHELMHHFLDHIRRSYDVCSKEERADLYKVSPQLLKNEMTKQNICMDLEVNCNMVADGICKADFWDGTGFCFDEKYYGKMFEEIYNTDGDKLFKKYVEASKVKLPEEYFEIVKGILEAMKVLRDREATDKEKDIATAKLRDLMMRLLGDTKETKMTIRKRLQKLQKTNIKEIGEIGPLLAKIIEDLMISPRNMSDDDISNFYDDVEALKKEMLACTGRIAKEFECSIHSLPKDIEKCMDTLRDGVVRINMKKDMTAEEMEEITREVILQIDKLLADNLKKKRLDDEYKRWMLELEKKKKEREEKLREREKRRHILKGYVTRVGDLSVIYNHGRMSEKSNMLCGELISISEPLLDIPEIDKIGEKIKEIGLDRYKEILSDLSESLFSDLMELKRTKILWDREETFFRRICYELRDDSFEMFRSFTDPEMNETEILSCIKIGIATIRKIGREFHRQAKVRASEEYKDGYRTEYRRLYKIYKELGEKGLRDELGVPPKEELDEEYAKYIAEIQLLDVSKVYWNVVEKDYYYGEKNWYFVFGSDPKKMSENPDWNCAVYLKIKKKLPEYILMETERLKEKMADPSSEVKFEPFSLIYIKSEMLKSEEDIKKFEETMKKVFPKWEKLDIE